MVRSLVPAVEPRPHRPGAIGWLRVSFAVGIALLAIGVGGVAWTGTPVRVLIVIPFLLLSIGALVVAFGAIARGRRWALWYGIAFSILLVVTGIGSVLAAEPPDTFTIPLGSLLGGGVLLGIALSWRRLQAFVAGSPPIGAGLRALLVASLVGPLLTTPVVAAVPDPTQATADDLRLTLTVRCDRGTLEEPGFTTRRDTQRVTIVADMAWRRGDLLPNGLDGVINPMHYLDTAGFRLVGTAVDDPFAEWAFVPSDTPVVDGASGEPVGWFGGGAPSEGLLPPLTYAFTVAVPPAEVRAGRALRATWLLVPAANDGDAEWPVVEVAYAHLDRFLLRGAARCGETAEAVHDMSPHRAP